MKMRGSAWIGAAFAVLIALVIWGYTGGSTKPAPVAAAPAPVTAPAPAAAPAPAMAATPAAPSASSGSASMPAPVATAQPSAPVATTPGVAAAESQAAAAVATDGPRAAPSPDTVQVRGVIKPKEEVLFSSKIAARIATMPFKEGARFKKGALLVGFDCSRLRAEANAAWAANRASKEIQKQSVALDSYNAIGKSEVQIAHAKAAQTGAEAEAIEAQIKDCTISAPFSGVVVENMAHQYENVGPGKDLTKVLNDDELEVHLVAPSSWLSWLQVGSTFRFKVDETGRTLGGKIIRLGASVDPVSQTVRVVGTFAPHNDVVLPGMSGSADFPQAQRAPKS